MEKLEQLWTAISSQEDKLDSEATAKQLDEADPLHSLRKEFLFPTRKTIGATLAPHGESEGCAYLCGNSLGLLSKETDKQVKRELENWASHAVLGHFNHPDDRPWMHLAGGAAPKLAQVLGCKEGEAACMSTLTANLHLMMASFYNPTPNRYKILCEAHAFPSDQYAFASQVKMHNFDPKDAIIELSPREGEYALREEDILAAIEKDGQSVAVVLFSGIQYFSGQFFPIENITRAAQAQGCIAGWDLAHAVGNVPLKLHDWNVDFAVFCTYKYLNSGPGGIGGLFMHERWNNKKLPLMAGWWGHDPKTRFKMLPTFEPIVGAQGFQQSNPSVLTTVALMGSLDLFARAGGLPNLRRKSLVLTAYLEKILKRSKYFHQGLPSSSSKGRPSFTIITPSDPEARGAQLSLFVYPAGAMPKVFQGMVKRGIIGDQRNPDVIRLSPAPIYNSFEDCWRAARALEDVLGSDL